MHPEIPETKTLSNPYTYSDAAQWKDSDDPGSERRA